MQPAQDSDRRAARVGLRGLALLAALGAVVPVAGCATGTAGGATARAAPGPWSTLSAPAAPPQAYHRLGTDEHGPRYATLLFGERRVDDDWDPLDEPPVIGIVFDETDPETGHGIEVGFTYSEDDATAPDPIFGLGSAHVEVETFEVFVGWRRTFRHAEEGLHPYVAAGASGVRMSARIDDGVVDEKENDMEPGLYLRGGLLWDVGPTTRCGLDYRYVLVDEHTLGGQDIQGDFHELLFTFGWAF